jgi:hypothetical protein
MEFPSAKKGRAGGGAALGSTTRSSLSDRAGHPSGYISGIY